MQALKRDFNTDVLDIAKFLRTLISRNICERLVQYYEVDLIIVPTIILLEFVEYEEKIESIKIVFIKIMTASKMVLGKFPPVQFPPIKFPSGKLPPCEFSPIKFLLNWTTAWQNSPLLIPRRPVNSSPSEFSLFHYISFITLWLINL